MRKTASGQLLIKYDSRSRIFALGPLRVGHKHLAADLYRFIGISATPSAL